MRSAPLAFALLALSQSACSEARSQDSALEASISDEVIFKAAGFKLSEGSWRKCGDPGTSSYSPGAIFERGDFNQDGLPDALVTEGGTYCFGMTGSGYTLVSQGDDGTWRILDERIGPTIEQSDC